ncbi:neuropeptide receptor 15-like [Babylonia areolata]|uniref:neuropeptide receptor 15-like n=1 Tax=Babylonia areolata TaxID=304850 RepID=UPI003FCF08EE
MFVGQLKAFSSKCTEHTCFLLMLEMLTFIGIVFPIKAHVVCTRRKVLYVIAVIWPLALLCGLPTALFNRLTPPYPPTVTESLLFYFLPMITQVVLYAAVCRRLFASMEDLQCRFQQTGPPGSADSSNIPLHGHRDQHAAETIRARKGVVKMLVASVAVYVVSYSPLQPPPQPQSWTFFVFVMVLTHLNSAANPVLYAIFSQNFRRNFKRCLCFLCFSRYQRSRRHLRRRQSHSQSQSRSQGGSRNDSFADSRGMSQRRASTPTTKSAVTRV